ncbi:MAG: menaquinone biosynthesis protein [Desulfovibrionaceae bacterium]|nr:menaquinone biosynthesis protein [Desulfovibrionaceae bacterium]
MNPIRLGRIGYLNVLPIYHPLESGLIGNDCEVVSGPPSELNILMDEGKLDISAASSVEYARHADKYYLVPDIAIGSRGPVQSVLLLSRCPARELDGKSILVSAQTHTSATLLRVLQAELWHVETGYATGNATAILEQGGLPDAILAIGDEALNLRHHPAYPHRIDLGEAWRELTGLPFIFGVWIVQREIWNTDRERLSRAAQGLLEGKKWGIGHMDRVCAMATEESCLSEEEMRSYFQGLVYEFGDAEQQGLLTFFNRLKDHGLIYRVPELRFLPTDAPA